MEELKRIRRLAKTVPLYCWARSREMLGAPEQFCIRAGYRHRQEYRYFDDTPLKDEWQKEVYIRAAAIAQAERVRQVYDVGCGSAFKLMQHFGDYETIGFDVPETLPFLQQTYPDRTWKSVSFADRGSPPADLVICSDVIEHVPDPAALMAFIKAVAAKWVVLSTPDRDITYERFSRHHFGPPGNPSHLREWSFGEFGRFVAQYFAVKEHVISNREQATQMIVATV